LGRDQLRSLPRPRRRVWLGAGALRSMAGGYLDPAPARAAAGRRGMPYTSCRLAASASPSAASLREMRVSWG
jgi:hypothetical protein